jgi:hypothetical protein
MARPAKQAFPAPAPAEPPEIVFDVTPVRRSVRRLTQADVDRHADWLVPLIQEQWGGPSLRTVNGWLRLWMSDNAFNIACTDNAVSLAMIDHDPMDPRTVIQEVFTFCRDGFAADEVVLYQHFIRWGASMQAVRFQFSKVEGERKERMKSVFPDFRWRSICYLDIE